MSRLAPGFLIASSTLDDDLFGKSVVLLVSHDDAGAFGWIINGPPLMSFKNLVAATGRDYSRGEDLPSIPVQKGGPVKNEQVWLLYPTDSLEDESQDEVEVAPGIEACTSTDLLDRLAQGLDLPQVRAVAGYSSWGPGQLESEISRGDWLPGPPSPKLVFRRERSKLWLAAYAEVGTSPFAFSTKKIGRA
ncbi:MAG: YqgE/AlgH family protein [Polyangiaceae bacterium]|nr:YqgE/AlgH family protein [Polyangiaceae bacterium]